MATRGWSRRARACDSTGGGQRGVWVLEGKRGEWGGGRMRSWGRRTNAELGAVVAPGRRWRDDIGKGREGEGEEEDEE